MDNVLTFDKLAEKARPLFGQVVLVYGSDLAILHGVGWTEWDFYYICRPRGYKAEPVWYSAVGYCEGLKDHLPPEMYERIENQFKLNGPMPDSFEMKVQIVGSDPEDYDPARHPAEMEVARQRAHEEAVARSAELSDVLDIMLGDETAS
ncbi:hypothetical protein ACGYLO_18900 [Sulfitobacter sp. 1A13353]|jgi:hypothetical protein|uniref:hypothetical protein n=1 Tax=Sulfitobacter sp. 1A13353 TaxID=3368568 RepID=UPI003746EB21